MITCLSFKFPSLFQYGCDFFLSIKWNCFDWRILSNEASFLKLYLLSNHYQWSDISISILFDHSSWNDKNKLFRLIRNCWKFNIPLSECGSIWWRMLMQWQWLEIDSYLSLIILCNTPMINELKKMFFSLNNTSFVYL